MGIIKLKVFIGLLGLIVLMSCTSSSAPSGLSCEQKFDRALANGTSYAQALGNYTQCIIDRDGTVNASIPNR